MVKVAGSVLWRGYAALEPLEVSRKLLFEFRAFLGTETGTCWVPFTRKSVDLAAVSTAVFSSCGRPLGTPILTDFYLNDPVCRLGCAKFRQPVINLVLPPTLFLVFLVLISLGD